MKVTNNLSMLLFFLIWSLLLVPAIKPISAQDFTISENGIVSCNGTQPGDTGTINGITYESVDRALLEQRRDEGADLSQVCTTLVTNMSSLFYVPNKQDNSKNISQNSDLNLEEIDDKEGDFLIKEVDSQINENEHSDVLYKAANSKAVAEFNDDIGSWDVSNVTNMRYMFSHATSFNGDLSAWDVSSVTDMRAMFQLAESFNQDLSAWDVSNVTNMGYIFSQATSFNSDLSAWDVSSVTDMRAMFQLVESFNQDLSAWDVSSVTDMSFMFSQATSFNSDLSAWDVSSVTNMRYMFQVARIFNQDLSAWDVSSVTNIRNMFSQATSFNGDLSAWDVSRVTEMRAMFPGATSFNSDISAWDVSNVTNMGYMFYEATSFNRDISAWDVSNVTGMRYMFYEATSYNSDLSGWCVELIPEYPENFADYSSLSQDQLPIWGTCPENTTNIDIKIVPFYTGNYVQFGPDPDDMVVGIEVENLSQQTVNNIKLEGIFENKPVELYSSQFNNSRLSEIDELAANQKILLRGVVKDLEADVESGEITMTITEVDGQSSNNNFSSNVSHYYVGNPDKYFDLGKDAYQFKNPENLSQGEVSQLFTENSITAPTNLLIRGLNSWNGRCFGMSYSSGTFFDQPSAIPYGLDDKYTDLVDWLPGDTDVRATILDYQLKVYTKLATVAPELIFGNNYSTPLQVLENIKSELKDDIPAPLLMQKEGFDLGHVVLATKVVVFEDEKTANIWTYDSNRVPQPNNSSMLASIDLKEDTFKFTYSGSTPYVYADVIPIGGLSGFEVLKESYYKFLASLFNYTKEKIVSLSPSSDSKSKNSSNTSDNEAYLLVTDENGLRAGYLNDGTFVNEISGAKIERVQVGDNQLDSLTVINLPLESEYEVEIISSGSTTSRFEYYDLSEDGSMLNWSKVDDLNLDENSSAKYSESSSSNIQIDRDGDGTYEESASTESSSVSTSTDIEDDVPVDFLLEQNYPNPFNPTTNISYSLPESGKVTISVYTMLGQKVATLVEGIKPAGRHTITFNASNFSSGTYLIMLKAEGFTETRKMTLIK